MYTVPVREWDQFLIQTGMKANKPEFMRVGVSALSRSSCVEHTSWANAGGRPSGCAPLAGPDFSWDWSTPAGGLTGVWTPDSRLSEVLCLRQLTCHQADTSGSHKRWPNWTPVPSPTGLQTCWIPEFLTNASKPAAVSITRHCFVFTWIKLVLITPNFTDSCIRLPDKKRSAMITDEPRYLLETSLVWAGVC